MRVFTKKDLLKYNGKNGRPAYIAYEGLVYNVTESFLWKDGNHQALHKAGQDLTEALKSAPHGKEFLKKFPVVGILKE
ncbi:cytochrome B5 [Thermosipho affectus]|uniref:Cytochrome B5 n=1 Tax=Thermosipho affectus TaxID=660294 RepID=A0ABX3II09_9BACT|nr:cytochrome b5 domain-containing protein [Thermosipho affectus]ONN27467.1 cytochrome B5 [Thermosipho affectus]